MKPNNEVVKLLQKEFPEVLSYFIWKNEDNSYSVFDRYSIVPESCGYRVFCSATDVGIFSSTRTALSWCIADKNRAYNLARELHELDHKLTALNNDIAVRSALAERSRRWEFRDPVGTKLETKIIKKKQLENELTKCVAWAKQSHASSFETKKNNKR